MKEEKATTFEKQIDGIHYVVTLHFSTSTKETLVDKCKKLLKTEISSEK